MAAFEPVLTRVVGMPRSHELAVYESAGGYQALRRGFAIAPGEIVEMVKQSGLRGRGGAGFPCGMKWGFLPDPAKNPKPRYLVVNADESEPGTFKDRVILRDNPHILIEGSILSSYALGAHHCFIYIRGEYPEEAVILERAIAECREAGYVGKNILGSGFDLEIIVHRGAGAYICGEETSLLESLEGKRGYPRIKPPFPAVVGLYGCPTVINNVETIACVPAIVERGAEWFAAIGPDKNTGPKLFCISGHVERPGTYELPMGTPLKEIIEEHCGGVWQGRRLKAVIPGGSSTPVLTAEEALAVNMDFDSLAAVGSMLGSAAIIVMDETTDMVRVALNLIKFYHHESCGQCTPCREGCGWLEKIIARFVAGRAAATELDTILDICDNMAFKTVCPLGDAARMPIESYVHKFRDEFLAKVNGAGVGKGDGVIMPLLVTVIKILVVFMVTLLTVAYMTLAERKVSAFIQWRKGPNRVGPWGLLQPFADGLKFVFKEDFVPAGANRSLHTLAPILVMMPALVTFAVVPFGGSLPLPGGDSVNLVIADLSIGILFVFAIASLGVYGIAIGGWASNNKYSLFGGLRSSAQMISYEISLGLAVIPVIMFVGSLRLTDMVTFQSEHVWFVISQPLSFLLFLIAAFAETNRLPFDLPEAEPELVAGYHTEYSSMKFAMFFLGEYANMITAAALIVTLFFGGYHAPFLENLPLFQDNGLLLALLQIVAFLVKLNIWLFIFLWVRWSLPRFRYDQLMGLGWKVMLPLALLNIVIYGLVTLKVFG